MYSSYTILFTIELLHEYFLNRRCTDLEIIPADDTKALFKKIGIQGRSRENRYVGLIRENGEKEPFFNTATAKHYRKDYHKTVFRFYVKSANPLFLNYTNVNLNFSNRRKLYFTNLAGNSANGFLFLSAPVAASTNDMEYFPGNFVRDSRTGRVYEALRKHTSKKKAEITDPALWAPKDLLHGAHAVADHSVGKPYAVGDVVKQPGKDNVFEAVRKHISTSSAELTNASLWTDRGQGQLQYVSDSDLTDYSGGNYVFTLPAPVKKAEISVFGFNYDAAAPLYDVPVKDVETRTFDQPTTDVSVNFSSLKPGKYTLKVNKETRVVYYDPMMNAGDILGVIEIFNHLPGSDAYSFLTEKEKIRGINYSILFPSRRVLWKYVRKDGKAQKITDTGSTGYEFRLADNCFISSTPILLSEGAVKTLKLDFNTSDFSLAPLPNPSIERFSRCVQNGYDYLCSEVYLNY